MYFIYKADRFAKNRRDTDGDGDGVGDEDGKNKLNNQTNTIKKKNYNTNTFSFFLSLWADKTKILANNVFVKRVHVSATDVYYIMVNHRDDSTDFGRRDLDVRVREFR